MQCRLPTRMLITGARSLCAILLLLAADHSLRAADPAKAAGDETPTEIPAPVYVTSMLARDAAIHAELNLNPRQLEAVRATVAKVDQPLWRLRDVPPERLRGPAR